MPKIGGSGPSLPSGGVAGQILAKNSTADYDASWKSGGVTAPAGGSIPWNTGHWYSKPIGDTGGFFTSIPSATANTFMSVYIPNACTIVGVSGFSSPSVGCAFSLWSDSPTATSRGPATGIGAPVQNSLSTNWGTTTVSWPVPNAGLYWLGISLSSSVNVWHCQSAQTLYTGTSLTNTFNQYNVLYNGTYTYSNFATWPTSMASIATTPIAETTGGEPWFYFKVG